MELEAWPKREVRDMISDGVRFWKRFRSIILGGFFLGLAAGCVVVDQRSPQELEKAYGPNKPKVQDIFASKEVSPGEAWKIYLNASDPDGDMRFIQVSLWVPGGVLMPVRLDVPASTGGELSGYLVLYTSDLPFSVQRFGGSEITIYVALEDRAGHVSERAITSTRLILGAKEGPPPAGKFQERYLGTVPVRFMQTPGLGGLSSWP